MSKWQGDKPFESVDLTDEEKTPALIKSFFDKKLTCVVYGQINPSKVTGNMRFDLRGGEKAYIKFKNDYNSDGKIMV